MPFRVSFRNQGGPCRGGSPTMAHDKHLPPDGRAAFERLNDQAAMRPHVFDAGSLIAANDNVAPQPKPVWPAKELRLTRTQADFLKRRHSSVHQRVTDRTELILKSRGMLQWRPNEAGEYFLENSIKGKAALERWQGKGI